MNASLRQRLEAERRAEIDTLQNMMRYSGQTGHNQLDDAIADHMRESIAVVLRLQNLIGSPEE